MPKSAKVSDGATKSRPPLPAKGRARSAVKPRPSPRVPVDQGQAGWATDLVFDVREPKLAVSLRLDADVLRFFRGFGSGYQTRINEVLKAFMHARSGSDSGSLAIPAARLPKHNGNNGNGKRAR